MSDQELLDGLAKGDPLAGRQFADIYQVKVYNICYSFLLNVHDSEDLTQEVFIEAIRNAGKFRGDSKLGTWLYRIAVNRSLNHIRDNKKRKFWKDIDELFSFDRIPDHSGVREPESNNNLLEQKEQRNLIGEAIASLPEKQRIAFTLNKLEDMTYAEVAEVMQTTISSVESLIHRARTGLQLKLKHYFKS
ncbi:MAG: sigma-70 family RNA polymerase sigma factor [Bacteroidales bacterium]|nr:sigma-70 family RNA polymerase sigma factor [Bacteroidales bacterium]MBK9356532.1 sigma-70 family RNA polymerase sigma factor [Bacteroidales bacterium]